jgi:hypothetical protein
MQFVRIDFWPAGLVLASAALIALALRSLERFAQDATVRRTRRALEHALDSDDGDEPAPALRGGTEDPQARRETGVG